MDRETILTLLEAEVDTLRQLAADYPTSGAAVPSCPGWTVEDAFGHLGAIERWVTRILETGAVAEEPTAPSEPGESVPWFLAGTGEFLARLHGADTTAPCWGFGPPPRLAGFWPRRQLHEHVIHAWDIQRALGLPDHGIDPEVAADGIDEVLTVFVPRQIRLGRMQAPGAAVVLSGDNGTEWVVGEGTPSARLRAPVSVLYLVLWGRVDPLADSRVISEGSTDTITGVLSGPLVP